MATTTAMEAYYGTSGTPGWVAVGSNKLGFTNSQGSAGSASTINSIPVLNFQAGTHVINATPTDQCTNPHVPNYKWTASGTWSINNAAPASVSDASLTATGASFRWHFNDNVVGNRTVANVQIYVYNGTTTATQATGIDCAMVVAGNSMSSWKVVNDDTTTGPTGFTTGSIGGNNSSERVDGAGLDRGASPSNDYYWYCAASAAGETAGVKTAFAFGIYLEYV